MELQKTFWDKPVLPADVVMTPDFVSSYIVKFINPSGKCLDPCCGAGSFLKYLPTGSDHCEIKEGKDFFDYNQKVDWIIGNPPYSIFENFLRKSFELADNVSYLVPTNKIFQRQVIMDLITKWGGGKKYYHIWKRSVSWFSFWIFGW
jgi:hypothetical protein